MQRIYKNATEAFEMLYKYIMAYGDEFAGTKAEFNVYFTIQNPKDKVIITPERKFKEEYANYEYNWYVSGSRDAKEISEKAKIGKI